MNETGEEEDFVRPCVCRHPAMIGFDPRQHVMINLSGEIAILRQDTVTAFSDSLLYHDLTTARSERSLNLPRPHVQTTLDFLNQENGNVKEHVSKMNRPPVTRSCDKCVVLAYSNRNGRLLPLLVEALVNRHISNLDQMSAAQQEDIEKELAFFRIDIYRTRKFCRALLAGFTDDECRASNLLVNMFALDLELTLARGNWPLVQYLMHTAWSVFINEERFKSELFVCHLFPDHDRVMDISRRSTGTSSRWLNSTTANRARVNDVAIRQILLDMIKLKFLPPGVADDPDHELNGGGSDGHGGDADIELDISELAAESTLHAAIEDLRDEKRPNKWDWGDRLVNLGNKLTKSKKTTVDIPMDDRTKTASGLQDFSIESKRFASLDRGSTRIKYRDEELPAAAKARLKQLDKEEYNSWFTALYATPELTQFNVLQRRQFWQQYSIEDLKRTLDKIVTARSDLASKWETECGFIAQTHLQNTALCARTRREFERQYHLPCRFEVEHGRRCHYPPQAPGSWIYRTTYPYPQYLKACEPRQTTTTGDRGIDRTRGCMADAFTLLRFVVEAPPTWLQGDDDDSR